MSALLRIAPTLKFGSRRSVHILERNMMTYRRHWLLLVSGFFEPFFYLLSIGIGLNKLIGHLQVGHLSVSYATFVAPGMLATSAMNGAVIDALYNTFWKLKVSHTYDPVLATPLNVNDIALGEVLWSLVRGVLYSGTFLVCMVALGDYHSAWVVLALPVAVLTAFAFACVGLAACTWLRSWQDFDTVALVQLPIFLFSGTFFPISLYPGWLAAIVTCSPLYQSAALLRSCSLGQFTAASLVHVAYLVVMGLIGLTIAGRRFTRILAP
jgi:lipooligosaccharide transport system permease protein